MGTDDLAERAVLQGLIKLAAAFVHASRGNPAGVAKNLRGARDHLGQPGANEAGRELGVDVRRVLDGITEWLISIERWSAGGPEPQLLAIRIPRSVEPPPSG